MKNLYLFCLSLVILFCSPKVSKKTDTRVLAQFDASSMIGEAKEIMRTLGIPMRDSLHYDGKLKTVIIDSLLGKKGGFAMFSPDSGALVDERDFRNRIYPHPVVHISKDIDSILTENKDTSRIWEVYARHLIIHELTHFLQSNFDTINNIPEVARGSYVEYVKLPIEKEGFAAAAYYFLKHYSPDVFLPLSSVPVSRKEQLWEILINGAFRYTESALPEIFPGTGLIYR